MNGSLAERITAANADALRRINGAAPVLVGVRPAREAIPALGERTLLHAGPPVSLERMCGPMRGAVIGAMRYEGWARTVDEAEVQIRENALDFRCTHDAGAVGPMAGIISPSMPVVEVRDESSGAAAYAPLNEGIGAVLRFGAYDDAVLARLRWMAEVLAPALDRAVRRLGGLPLAPIMSRALTMGDEMHQRNVAATGLFYRVVAPALAESTTEASTLPRLLGFLGENDQFFLNLAMAAAKVMLAASRHIPFCTVVTVMSRNGVEFGIRVSGLGDRWFTTPAPTPAGLYFPGFGAGDANPDMGDSAILETVGLGGFAMAAAPAVVGFVGLGDVGEALTVTRLMGELTVGASEQCKIPALDFAGTPTGIDIRRVVRLETTPLINTGIAHRKAGVGQIGAGVVRAPLELFQEALAEFGRHYATDAGVWG